MSDVRVLQVAHVAPSPTATPPAGHVKLSFFDTPWIILPPIQRLFFYEGDGLPAYPSLVESLKSSLAATLAHYLPLAGKLTYLPSSGDLVVDCSPDAIGAGVAFVEAEADGDVRRLAGDEEHDIPAFLRLVPELDKRELPAPALSVQVTWFTGGVAVGVSVDHVVADGRAVWRFMEAWGTACRVGSPVTAKITSPVYGREVVRHPRGDEMARENLKKVAPALPKTAMANFDISGRFRLARRTFALSADRIQSLKQHINNLATEETGAPAASKPVSTFVALSALVWTAFARSKSLNPDDDSHIAFLADLRSRLDPPLDEGYFGNCVNACNAKATAGDLLGNAGLLHASRAVQKAVREMAEDPLAGCDNWIDRMMRLPFTRLTNVAASPRFMVYETDFGFGKPSRVELVSMNHDGEVVLVGGKKEGEVQLSVSLHPTHMEAFKSHILSL